MGLNKAVFLDRDGVINKAIIRDRKPYAPSTFDEFEIIHGVKKAVSSLKKTGYLIVVVTNQPDVGNGYVDKKIVEKMNKEMLNDLQIDAVKVCFHKQTDGCECRKPKPGMLLEAAQEYDINLTSSYMIGDRKSDIEAGIAAGCKTVFIDNNYILSEQPITKDLVACSLLDSISKLKSVGDYE